jgi:hypothetical protein
MRRGISTVVANSAFPGPLITGAPVSILDIRDA